MNNHVISKLKWPSTILLGFILGACSNGVDFGSNSSVNITGSTTERPSPVVAFNRFPDIPIPPGGEIDLGRTLVFGADEAWFGRLKVDSSLDQNELFNFFKQEVPGFKWQEITSIRSSRSFLTYVRGTRAVTIQIESGLFSGTSAVITMSPRENQTLPSQKIGRPSTFSGAPAPRFKSGSSAVSPAPIQ